MKERAIDERRVSRAKRAKRSWTAAAKLRIVEESNVGSRQVSETARRHGVSPTLLFYWRKLAREGLLGVERGGFAAAKIVPPPTPDERVETAAWRHAPGAMEIVVEGAHVIVDASVEAEALARVLSALRQSMREELAR